MRRQGGYGDGCCGAEEVSIERIERERGKV